MAVEVSQLIGPLARSDEQLEKCRRLLEAWWDLFVESIREMPETDLIEHRIPTYKSAIPTVAKPALYTSEEINW